MAFMLRPAKADDLPAIARLMNSAFRGSGPDSGWSTESAYIDGDRTSESALREDLALKPDSHFLVAHLDSTPEPLGCVWLQPVDREIWLLGSLAIQPSLQNSGFGRELLQASEQWARARGATTIQMKVINIRDTLIAWYERRGYRRTGEVHPFPYGNDRFGTPLRDDLAFVTLEKIP